jgi:hypothetical protein
MAWQLNKSFYLYVFIYTQLFMCSGRVHDHDPSFPPDLFLYVNLGVKEAQKLFKTLAPSLQYWVSLTFADAYSRTLRPIDLYNVRPIPRE